VFAIRERYILEQKERGKGFSHKPSTQRARKEVVMKTYKVNAWIKQEDGSVVRYIRSGFDSWVEAMLHTEKELKDTQVLEISIFEEI